MTFFFLVHTKIAVNIINMGFARISGVLDLKGFRLVRVHCTALLSPKVAMP